MSSNPKSKPQKQKLSQESLTFIEAEQYLRKIEEWHSVSHLDRDIIIKWAQFLKNKNIEF
jgi:hypothetical protein